MWILHLPRSVCAERNVFMYSELYRDFKRRRAASFRKLHLFVSVLFDSRISLIISKSAAAWYDLNSSWCGHLSSMLFSPTLVQFYFYLLDLFHFTPDWVQMLPRRHLCRRLIDVLLLTCETCCLLSKVAFVQLYEFVCESLFS